jgi:hypothetical protein
MLIAITLAGVAAAACAALATAKPSSTKPSHHFTDRLVGIVLQTHGSRSVEVSTVSTNDSGPGAAVTHTRSVSATAGVFTSVIYLSDGSVRTSGLYEVSTPPNAAPGVVSITLNGHITGGTGDDAGAQGQFRGTGTDNTQTKSLSWTANGTITP